MYNVRDYGAVGDGVTDDTAAIQSAIDAATPASGRFGPGGIVYFPTGRYLVSATLTVGTDNVSLGGDGSRISVLVRETDYGDTVLVRPPDLATVPFQDSNNIKGLGFLHKGTSTVATTGAHIHYIACERFQFDDVSCVDHSYGGVLIESCGTSVFLDKLEILCGFDPWVGKQTYSFLMMFRESALVGGYKPPSEVFLSNFNFRGANSLVEYGLVIQGGDGIWFTNGHLGGVEVTTLQIEPLGSFPIQSLEFTNVYLDGFFTPANGLHVFPSATMRTENVHFANCVFKNHDGIGVCLQPGMFGRSFLFSNCEISNNGQNGVFIAGSGASDFRFTGCDIRGNNQSIGGYSQFVANNTVLLSITGSFVGRGASDPGADGIEFQGSCDLVSVVGNTFDCNGASDIIGGAGTHSKIAENAG